MGLEFEINKNSINEVYPKTLIKFEITDYLAKLKAQSFVNDLESNDILITNDTIVLHKNKAVEKPKNQTEAIQMIRSLSGITHEVFTSVCFTQPHKQQLINPSTKQELTAYRIGLERLPFQKLKVTLMLLGYLHIWFIKH